MFLAPAILASLALPAALVTQSPQDSSALAVQVGPWAVLGPFDCPGADVRVDTGVEKFLKRMKAGEPWPALESSFPGRGKAKLSWRWTRADEIPPPANGAVFETGTLDLRALLGASGAAGDNAVAYLCREIVAQQAGEFKLSCGSDDALRLWLDGELLLEKSGMRALNAYDDGLTLTLAPGTNHLLVKVTNSGGPWAFAMVEPRPTKPLEINQAIDRGVAWLLAQQLVDGSWGERQGDYPSGQTALSLYALLKSGVSAQHAAVQQALLQLEARPADRTYSLACQVFAVAALQDPARQGWLAKMTEQLLAWQQADGGWSYPGDQTDLSNTQYAALALRAALRAGVEIPAAAWTELADFALRHQESRRKSELEAGFSYTPGNDAGYTGSMTTAGIGMLAICRAAHGERMSPQQRQATEAGIEAGVAWLEKHWTVTQNPNKGDYHLYYLYGLERVGSLLEREKLGSHAWYTEGAQFLVHAQEASGAWPGTQAETCFALLFLARATGPVTGEVHDARLLATSPDPIRLRVRNATPATLWIDPPTLASGQGLAHVEFFVRRAGDAWARVGEGDKSLAMKYAFGGPGTWEVRAEAVLADGERLVSTTLSVAHDEGLSPAQRAAAGDVLRNHLASGEPSTRASSAAEAAVNATDNHTWTRWLCDAKDADPWIEVDLAKSLVASRLLLTHARTTQAENEGANPRPTRLELWLDHDKTPRVIEVDPDPRTKTAIEFDPPRRLSRFKLRLVALTGGTLGESSSGFSEIELQEPDKKKDAKGR
ncbi:MAG: hypothetical protein EXS08_13955 [Planctomycetes bacterium]|nr:hypothetical protein [Planctomycetota bacterium]